MKQKKISRRLFLAGAAALGGCRHIKKSSNSAVPLNDVSESEIPSRSSNIHIVDLANGPYLKNVSPAWTQPNHRFLSDLKTSGVDTVIRYYSDRNNGGLTCKNITKSERELLHDYGFAIGIVYQYQGRSRNRYTKESGRKDSRFILERAQEINQPNESAIYIGVDADSDLNPEKGVVEYFSELRNAFGRRFKIGAYAAGERCKALKREGLADYFWVPEAPGWDGTSDFMRSGEWTFYQNKTEVNHSLLARHASSSDIELDTNFINPSDANTIGAFNREGSIKTYNRNRISSIANSRFWVKSLTINLRDTPNGKQNGMHMCVARSVRVLSVIDGWASIDINEDGDSEGYCAMTDLAPYASMPDYVRGCSPMDL